MTIWLDAQLSPVLANWVRAKFNVRCFPIRDVCDKFMYDETLALRAKREADILISKDVENVHLLRQHVPPPKGIWLRMGNTSNSRMKELFAQRWAEIQAFAEGEEP